MRASTRPVLLLQFVCLAASADLPAPLDCNNNIHQIDGAKQQLQIDRDLKVGDPVAPIMLTQYFRMGLLPQCPSGGSYTIGAVGQLPVCSIETHSEAEIRRFIAEYRQPTFPWLLFVGRFALLLAAASVVALIVRGLIRRYSHSA